MAIPEVSSDLTLGYFGTGNKECLVVVPKKWVVWCSTKLSIKAVSSVSNSMVIQKYGVL